MTKSRICLGAFAGAHGVRGDVRIKTFTEAPENIAAYGPVETEDGARRFALALVRILKDDIALVRAPEIRNREEAQALAGTRVYVARAALPPTQEDEFYLDDLVGLLAVSEAGAALGTVTALHNFGAGDIIELSGGPGEKPALLLPFSKATAPLVDLENRRIVIAAAALATEDDEQG